MVDDTACHRVDTSNSNPLKAPKPMEYAQSLKEQGISHRNFDTDAALRSPPIDHVTGASLHSGPKLTHVHHQLNDLDEKRKLNALVASGEQSHRVDRHQNEMHPVKVPTTTLSTSSASHSSQDEKKCPDVMFIQQN